MFASLRPALPYALALILFILALVLVIVLLRRRYPRYITRPLMTSNEREFFGRLTRALPTLHVFPQVAMSAVIQPVASYEENKRVYWDINKKIIDYVVYTRSMELVCLIELDDRTHDPARDALRDRATASAGIVTLRFESRDKPSVTQIRAIVQDVLAEQSLAEDA